MIPTGPTKVKLAATRRMQGGTTAIDLTSAVPGRRASPGEGGAGERWGSLGIGASVALNIANTTAMAELSDTAC